MWLRRIALALAVAAVALLACSGLGVHAGLWPFGLGIRLFGAAIPLGVAAAVAAIIALAIPRLRAGGVLVPIVALLVGVASALVPLERLRQARALPAIHDITTDTETPPQFVAIVPLRAGAPNPPGYEPHVGQIQKLAYPHIRPLELAAPPAQAFASALAAAQAMGWEIVAADEKAGRIEAVATTRWFGFKDDVVIRIAPAAAGSKVDVRSKSRVGLGDIGTNAKRIQEFLTRLKTPR
jgi:uncharacterized protein (DUF1499 family)